MSARTLLLDYGAGNVRSAQKALERAGFSVEVSADPAAVAGADALVVPGQGHFRQVMDAFDASGFRQPILDAAGAGVPILGICVGMQMLLDGSEEAPGVRGLGLLPGVVKRFESGSETARLKIPQMGWNSIDRVGDSPLLRDLACPAYAYFVHSYYVPLDVDVDSGAISEYGTSFWSVVSHGNIHATQFHPEKSGDVGLNILRAFRKHVVDAQTPATT